MSKSDESPNGRGAAGLVGGPNIEGAFAAAREALQARPNVGELSDEEIQDLLAVAIVAYAQRREDHYVEALGGRHLDAGITATEAVIGASGILDALSVEVFELGMWKAWGTV
jgi:hypothetical protein